MKGDDFMWKPVVYRDVVEGMYEASSDGDIREVKSKKPVSRRADTRIENGYIRCKLKTVSGKSKEYPMHRVVLSAFTPGGEKHNMEVDHIYGDKQDNRPDKLEWVTADENKHRAATNEQYESCEDHYKAIFTNAQVRQMCELFQEGNNVRKVAKIMGLRDLGYSKDQIDYNLDRIARRKSWKNISKYYTWDIDDIRLKVYKKKDLQKIAYLLFTSNLKYKEIANLFPQYGFKQIHQVIKKMAQGKLYKSIMDEVERSTTINNFIDQMMLEGYC